MAASPPKWPDWMKPALVDGFTVQIDDLRTISEMDVGRVIRLEFPNEDRCTSSGSLFLNSIEANWFEVFERDILVQGSRPFWFPLWVGGQLINHKVRFLERLQWGNKAGPYTVYSFTVEVFEREGLMPPWLADLLLDYGPETWIEFSDRLHEILHVWPGPKFTNTPSNIWTATPSEWEAAK